MSTPPIPRPPAWLTRLPASFRRRWDAPAFAAVSVPYVLYLLHALVFRNWIVDDAGISFVYARSLAQGFGLVSQPGSAPVEGFSNFTWTVLLAPFFSLRLFDPLLTPKLISAALVLVTLILLHKLLARSPRSHPSLTFVVLSLLAANSPFVIWTTSGLENPLYVCLIVALAYWTSRSTHLALGQRKPVAALLGGLAALTAMTRPDGVLYALVFPAWLGLASLWDRSLPRKHAILSGGLYLLVFVLLYGGFLAFRRLYFGELFPNPYYAKGGPTVQSLWALVLLQDAMLIKIRALLTGAAGPAGLLILGGILGATFFLVGARRFRRDQLLVLLFLAVSAAIYLLLPDDWMGEFRFATPFFVFAAIYAVSVSVTLFQSLVLPAPLQKSAVMVAVTAVIGASALVFIPRTVKFAANPTAPFATVTSFAQKVSGYAARLGLAQASLLLPDVGGALYHSDLRIYDLAGLTDKTIARTIGRDPWALYDYVFETLKPTFIQTHSHWSVLVFLDQDPRFRRDYIALHEYLDEWALAASGATRYSGEYVRRDAVADQLPRVFELRSANGLADGAYEDFLLSVGYPAVPKAADLLPLTPISADIGGVARVLGAGLSQYTLRPGETLTVTVHWNPLASTDRPYTVFVHILDPIVGSVAQVDMRPRNGRYDTTTWIPGRPFLDSYVLTLAEDAPAATAAQVVFGLYDLQTLERLPVTNQQTGVESPNAWVEVGHLEVSP